MSSPKTVLRRLPRTERRFIADALRQETVGGVLLLTAAVAALIWANSPWREAYYSFRDTAIGPEALHLHLTLGTWAADGLLAVFFFVAGVELKRELVVGTLRNRADAALPIAAALCGMVVPALIYVAFTANDSSAVKGWGIPMATDIAFALAVLAVVGRGLPASLRALLLTLAVVDDLGAITVIAVFYTDQLSIGWLLAAVIPLAAYWYAQRRGITTAWLAIPLGVAAWVCIHSSGVHATVAGITMGLLTPVVALAGQRKSTGERYEHRVRPWSAAVCVPAFAFLSAGVTLVGAKVSDIVADPAAQGVVVGLVVGKFIGVFGGAYLIVRWTRARLNPELSWWDIAAVALLAGIGFTVSLLIAELAFDDDPTRLDHVKVAILAASVIAAVLSTLMLARRKAAYRALAAEEALDTDDDGIPDVYPVREADQP